jgi:hypothetical protein
VTGCGLQAGVRTGTRVTLGAAGSVLGKQMGAQLDFADIGFPHELTKGDHGGVG